MDEGIIGAGAESAGNRRGEVKGCHRIGGSSDGGGIAIFII